MNRNKRIDDLKALLSEHGFKGVVIAQSDDGKCELCGKTDETRPYGPNGENVCFDCGMKNEDVARQAFARRLSN